MQTWRYPRAQTEILAKLDQIWRTQVQKQKLPYNRDDTVLKDTKFTLAGKLGDILAQVWHFQIIPG